MAGTAEYPEPPDLIPNSQYPPEPSAHYSQPAYSFTRGSANYPGEQDMGAVDNFNRSMPGSMDSMPSSTNGHPQPHSAAISPSQQPEMAPPQNAHQQQFPSPTTAQRPSIDGSQDMSGGMDSSKRKRSKVSRACDECRRKKVQSSPPFRLQLILTRLIRYDVMPQTTMATSKLAPTVLVWARLVSIVEYR